MSISNIYIFSATEKELAPLMQFCNEKFMNQDGVYSINSSTNLHILQHGVGLLEATFNITKMATNQAQFIIQAGIAGSFNKNLAIGNVYCVGADRVADIGAEHHDGYKDAFEMQLINENENVYTNGWLLNTQNPYPIFFHGLMHVNAITVNTVSGQEKSINLWKEKYKPTLESMEGAALHYVCLKQNIPFVQIRAISNYVEIRNKDNWNIPLAIKNLNEQLIDFVTQISIQ